MKTLRITTLIFLWIFASKAMFGQTVSTFASAGTSHGVAVDKDGNVYITVYTEYVIKKITPAGVVSTFAGSGVKGDEDGTSSTAKFNSISNLTIDTLGNLYVADYGTNKIKKVTPNGDVTTFAGTGSYGLKNGDRLSSTFNGPVAVEFDQKGNLYVADYYNYAIRKIDTDGQVTTLAGAGVQGDTEGDALTTKFNRPSAVAIHPNGDVYVADQYNNKIKVIKANGTVSTFAGSGVFGDVNGKGLNASFNYPTDLVFDDMNNLYITDQGSHKIRKITPDSMVTTYAGSTSGDINGPVSIAKFGTPLAIAIDSKGDLYFTDIEHHTIKKISNSLVSSVFDTYDSESTAVIYPVPAKEKVMVQASGIEILHVYGLTGELLLEKSVKDLEEVNIQSLEQGVYFYSLGAKKGSFVVQ